MFASVAGFGLSAAVLDATFRKMREDAGIEGLHFHDSRHTACTRLSRKLDALQLARMLGIKDLRILLDYFNEPAEDIAALGMNTAARRTGQLASASSESCRGDVSWPVRSVRGVG